MAQTFLRIWFFSQNSITKNRFVVTKNLHCLLSIDLCSVVYRIIGRQADTIGQLVRTWKVKSVQIGDVFQLKYFN